MKHALPLILLALAGCATVQSYANCDTAKRVIQAAQLAAARYCPMEAN
ncbi:hypothetical protein [Sphingobium sp. CCH11-B1]|nr:hypothetical protein [Sphingobium sp. CCH11-B1]